MTAQWTEVGTVEVLSFRVYPIDPEAIGSMRPNQTEVSVKPGIYPVYRKHNAFRWIMKGTINERFEKMGDATFGIRDSDTTEGLEVQFPSSVYGRNEFKDFLQDPMCQPGPEQRLRFEIGEALTK